MICNEDLGFNAIALSLLPLSKRDRIPSSSSNAIAHFPLPETRSHPLIPSKRDGTSSSCQTQSHPLILPTSIASLATPQSAVNAG
jgi:hypothetical protein